ncbi:hypothetical protein CISIN_1g012298mg [Citrus sinensis]|uniref:CCHC-type domain-containing protein n=1 Tax=Citrus sinensis TaxID=2711 RepID=A0A067H7K4_CITSI|nr:uncharacterized protein LOC18050129 isoform X3 [Citrus x clementina]KDO86935.1 hypothetical protein CISIN_1g012298mg [Citrus sinensis]
MAKRPDPDDDDDFSELYKEYTGPPGSMVATSQEKAKANKRSLAGSDEEEEPRDPNAVPTDFTSREAKVWEAKSKATERNWKKRKEEEMICKICGESGHFTQGCPSTLGANRKSQDFFERVAARDKHVRALFTEKVIQRIEKDISCKIKMDEKFIIVSGKDRLILSKGVDAVHKIIKEEGDQRGTSSSHKSKSRSPEQSPVGTQLRRSESQRSHPVSHNASHFHQRICRQDKVVEDRVREDVQKFSRGSPQARAYGSDGARGRSSHSKSPGRPPYASNLHNSYDGHNQSMGGYRNDGWDIERRGSDMQSGHQFEYPAFPKTLDELELDYTREAMELGRIRDKEEDEENYKHRETIREMRESYMKKLTQVRAMHAKQWEEFLQLDGQRHQHQAREQMSASGFGGYKQHNYSSYDGSSTNSEYAGTSYPMDSRGRYPNPMETYPSRAHDTHGGFQRQRREEFGKAYNRY